MFHDHGEVAERPNAGALKASEGKTSGGSNPSLAAEKIDSPCSGYRFFFAQSKVGFWVEKFQNVTGNQTVGQVNLSTKPPSASICKRS